jgi:hypothetical protein
MGVSFKLMQNKPLNHQKSLLANQPLRLRRVQTCLPGGFRHALLNLQSCLSGPHRASHHITVQTNRKALGHPWQGFEEPLPVGIAAKDRPPLIAPRGDVIPAASHIDQKRAHCALGTLRKDLSTLLIERGGDAPIATVKLISQTREDLLRQEPDSPSCREHPSAESSAPGTCKSAWCDQSRDSAGSSRSGRGRGPGREWCCS